MKKSFIFLVTTFFLLVLSGSQVFAATYSWSLNDLSSDYSYTQGVNGDFWGSGYYTTDGTASGDTLYDINYATTLVDGTGDLESTGTTGHDGDNYNKWVDGTETRNWGTGALGTPDMVYGDPEGTYEMWGMVTGFKPHEAGWMTYGFDAALDYTESLYVYHLGWGGSGVEVFVSTDETYTSDEDMTWISLGLLDLTSKPFSWGDYGTAPEQEYTASMLASAGVDSNINFVKFSGDGQWIDAVGGTAVPIPGSVLLLGSSLLSLIGIRRKRQ